MSHSHRSPNQIFLFIFLELQTLRFCITALLKGYLHSLLIYKMNMIPISKHHIIHILLS